MNRRDFNRILFLMAGFIIAVGTKGLAQGKIEIEGGTTYDWGKVNPAKLHTVLKVKNVGTADLHISEVKPTCSCTIDTLVNHILKPGEVTDLKLSVDVNGRTGQVEKVVTILSDDPTTPSLPITLKAFVKRPMTFEPGQYFYVHDAKVGQEMTSVVTIRNSGEEPFTLFPPEADTVNAKSRVRFDMTKKREVAPGDSVQIKAFITPITSGTINDSVKMRSTQKEFGTISLSVYGYVPPEPKTAQQK